MNKALNDIEVVSQHFKNGDTNGCRSYQQWEEIIGVEYSLLCGIDIRHKLELREKLLDLAGAAKAWIDVIDENEKSECENCKKLKEENYRLNRDLSRILRIANKEE